MSKTNKPTDVFRLIDMSGGPEACWPFKGALNSENRPYISIDGKKHLAYRVTYDLVNKEKLGDRMFRHTCDNEICCNPSHGIPGDQQQNMDDMKERERHGLPHHTVRYVRRLINEGKSQAVVAALTGLAKTTVHEIASGKNYSHVKEVEDGS